ncbi:MAG: hypothetical protein JWM68_5673 [Verrucomicrobiales bacterium]|nr:hypothetical protein [Verrucomicrobiales bacterium]
MKISFLKTICLSVALLLAQMPADARVNVVSLPKRNSVQLTIYNSVDLTLVKETRFLTLRKGMNKLEFSWANTLIDPTSLEFRALTHADEVEVLDVSYPPRVSNTLEWRINSEFVGEVQVEIRYFTSGISWNADYVAEANKPEKLMNLAGNVRVTNNSGEDYENAQVRLVVGVVRLVEEILQLAGQTRTETAKAPMAAAKSEARRAMIGADAMFDTATFGGEKPREIAKEGISEYFLYTVEGRDTILNQWSKRMPSFQAADVPIVSYYKYEKEQFGNQVMRFYRFKNDKASKLGVEPLPDGGVKALRIMAPDNSYSFVGSTSVKYIPINEAVELQLGNDQEVMVKPTLMNWEKADIRFDKHGNVVGWTTKETWDFEVQNSKEIDVVVDIRRTFPGDWSVETEAKYENVDQNKIKFVLPLKAHGKQKFSYKVTTNYGINVTK